MCWIRSIKSVRWKLVRDLVSCVFSICDVISVDSQYIIDKCKAG